MPRVTGWLLAGGEGRRMQGQDKGLVNYQGHPLATWVLNTLYAQCAQVRISANRNLPRYQQLMRVGEECDATQGVYPDDTDLQGQQGPLAGIITAMRHTDTDWLMIAPCDTPHLPKNLVERLMQEALQTGADIVIPCTQSGTKDERHHWVCGLIRKRICTETMERFVNGERKVGNWVQSQHWARVSFPESAAFANLNTLEALRDQP
jgi:molybdopterin-guanine dinucleotide biosynthesis protein A